MAKKMSFKNLHAKGAGSMKSSAGPKKNPNAKGCMKPGSCSTKSHKAC